MSYILYTWYHGITQNEDNKFLFRPVSESQLHELRLLRDLKDWVRFLSQPKYVCMNLYFLCICLINLISFMAKQWTDQLCQRKLSSGRSQCWTSLLTYWSAQLRFPKTLPIYRKFWTLEKFWTVNTLEWQNDETKRQIDQSVPAPVSGEQFFDKN